MALSPEIRDLLALHLVPGIGPRLTAALLERFGSAAAVLRAREEEVREVQQIGPKLARNLTQACHEANVAAELERLQQGGVHLLALGTPEYPTALAPLPDVPHLLYVRGQVIADDARAVALVGSRHCTDYGRRVATRLATGLAHAGYTVVSGLARGIDGVAHQAALQAGGRTLAVLAGGLARIYPPEHAELARAVEARGALLTESRMNQEPLAALFPARNRIISGLCQAVVLIEAAERSGALITASHAADQGRTVCAVPGPVDSPASGGTNALIRTGAILIRDVDDILEELHGVSALAIAGKTTCATSSPVAALPPGLDETGRRVWELLASGPLHLDEIVQRLGLAVPRAATMLLTLEIKKVVRRLPGNRYERC